MPLGEEEVDLVDVTTGQAESIDVHELVVSRMDTAEVDNQLAVDEDPNVIIAGELEESTRSADVHKLAMQLEGKADVVVRNTGRVAQ